MKKVVGILLLVLFAIGSVLPLYGATQTTIVLTIGSPVATVNGGSVTLDVAPFIKDSRTFVPLRFVSEQLGANVTYTTKPDGTVDQVIIKMGLDNFPSSTATENMNPWMLSDEQITEALQTGQSMHGDWNALSQLVREFYTQDLEGAGAPASKLTILTPYLDIVQRACVDPYFSFDQAKSIAEFPPFFPVVSLQFQVIAYGASIDFCANLKAVLILPNGSAIYPIHQQVPSFAYQNGEAWYGGIFWPNLSPNEPYQAFCSWDFDASRIGRNDTVTFILTRAEGEQKAVIDLSKYK
jgi:hypothetical protein